ncbi:MAG: cytochrome c family protein [Reyranella sp.]|nr:cytochrome c family protein [Reyranella sp.]
MKRLNTVLAVLVATLAMSTTAARAQAGDATKGERVFVTQCKACHTLERDGASVAGPNLYGIMARRSGTARGYGYSEAMRRFAIEWNDQTLAGYLRDPKGDMPGTKMVFAGIRRPDQLADLIAYLKEATR